MRKMMANFPFFVLETISVSSTNITCIFFYLAKMDPFTHIDQTFVHTRQKNFTKMIERHEKQNQNQ